MLLKPISLIFFLLTDIIFVMKMITGTSGDVLQLSKHCLSLGFFSNFLQITGDLNFYAY
jgi:hypothetical protein